eukprot:10648248-Lingulodinium_polyedra.AAC.1
MNNPIVLKSFVHQSKHGSPNGQRTIDCLAMFAGHGAVSKVLRRSGSMQPVLALPRIPVAI